MFCALSADMLARVMLRFKSLSLTKGISRFGLEKVDIISLHVVTKSNTASLTNPLQSSW